ncbi:uncharacterized protein LOC105438532 [Strongylocentrotus purpuratus]|uniref:NACHT domain-containing protein n=1 Tax=Strongylocentrotus purpuratus TaxID=7668 RepID=A0A7M7PE72_STRPU|nr:uncharacterized protein LOC105438532 [Strongylocentrotus purpuratus]
MQRSKEDTTVALRELLSQWDLRMEGVTRKQLEDALAGADVGGLCSIVKKHYEKDSTDVIAATRLIAGDGAVKDTRNQVINQSEKSDSEHTNKEDIYSEKISESMTVQQCRKKLENKYLDQLCKIQMTPWDRNDYADIEDMHTVVTMLPKKIARGKEKKEEEIHQVSVAEIFSTKVKGKLPARILISAPAGRGKTTAVAKMAYDWVHRKKGSALEHLPLLFVVKFRNTSQLTSIGEAIKSQLLSDVHDLTPEGLESFIRKNQGICHIILDGLDEYAGISSSQRSSGSNIMQVVCLKEFPDCRVLVTTRPHLENFFDQDDLPRVYTKMWIEGFSPESSCEYINKFFASTSNPCKGQSLKDYLHEEPLIDELVKTPLFCLMICHVWSEGLLDSDTTTQTKLLDKISKLDRVLRKIKANIGDYENLIRFTAGTDNSLCIRIMEALLSNRFLDESERYRILLDCSSETKGTEGNVSSLVQRCVTAHSIVLKSPTVYTVVGMQNLPKQLKHEVKTLKIEGSTLTTDVTNGLWSCLGSFSKLETLNISETSLSFPPSPPQLLSVTKLSAERMTPQSYERVLSSIPGVSDIDVSIDVAETSQTSQITTASRPMGQTRDRGEQSFVHIRLHAWSTLTTDMEIKSGRSIGGLSLLFEDQTKKQQRLHVFGLKGRDEEALVDMFVKTKQLTYLNSE